MMYRSIKAALLQVHSVIGVTISLILALIAITGATMSFEDEIGASLNAGIMRVEPRAAPMLAPDALVARLQAAQDFSQEFRKVSAVTMTSDPAAAVRIRSARNEGESRSSVYVDPYDGHVLGVPRGEEFFLTVRQLHRWLLLPDDAKGVGRQVTGVAAIGLIVMLMSGIVLRWPRHARNIRIWLKPNLALRGRGFHWSLHSVVGTWVMLIYLVMALTGLWYSFDWYRNGVTWLFSDRTAAPKAQSTSAQPNSSPPARAADSTPLTFDRAWSAFLRTQDGRYARAQLTLPSGAGTVIRIRSWTRDASHDGARDEFRIDAITGRVISSEIYADKPIGERVLSNLLDIHRGSLWGWPGKLLFMLAAALMPLIVVTGFILYLSRRKHRRVSRPMLGDLAPGE
jgi:sulfite reductase (NADPH) flavoprotein alpha-component